MKRTLALSVLWILNGCTSGLASRVGGSESLAMTERVLGSEAIDPDALPYMVTSFPRDHATFQPLGVNTADLLSQDTLTNPRLVIVEMSDTIAHYLNLAEDPVEARIPMILANHGEHQLLIPAGFINPDAIDTTNISTLDLNDYSVLRAAFPNPIIEFSGTELQSNFYFNNPSGERVSALSPDYNIQVFSEGRRKSGSGNRFALVRVVDQGGQPVSGYLTASMGSLPASARDAANHYGLRHGVFNSLIGPEHPLAGFSVEPNFVEINAQLKSGQIYSSNGVSIKPLAMYERPNGQLAIVSAAEANGAPEGVLLTFKNANNSASPFNHGYFVSDGPQVLTGVTGFDATDHPINAMLTLLARDKESGQTGSFRVHNGGSWQPASVDLLTTEANRPKLVELMSRAAGQERKFYNGKTPFGLGKLASLKNFINKNVAGRMYSFVGVFGSLADFIAVGARASGLSKVTTCSNDCVELAIRDTLTQSVVGSGIESSVSLAVIGPEAFINRPMTELSVPMNGGMMVEYSSKLGGASFRVRWNPESLSGFDYSPLQIYGEDTEPTYLEDGKVENLTSIGTWANIPRYFLNEGQEFLTPDELISMLQAQSDGFNQYLTAVEINSAIDPSQPGLRNVVSIVSQYKPGGEERFFFLLRRVILADQGDGGII